MGNDASTNTPTDTGNNTNTNRNDTRLRSRTLIHGTTWTLTHDYSIQHTVLSALRITTRLTTRVLARRRVRGLSIRLWATRIMQHMR